MKVKIIDWADYQPPRQWFPVLSCGHKAIGSYEEGLDDATKSEIEVDGVWTCFKCGEIEKQIADLECRLTKLKAKRTL